MAGHDDCDRVAIVCHPYRAEATGPADRACNVAVSAGLAIRNRQQRSPARQLKVCSSQIKCEAEFAPLAREIFVQLLNVGSKRDLRFLELHIVRLPAAVLRSQVARIRTDGLLAGKSGIEL